MKVGQIAFIVLALCSPVIAAAEPIRLMCENARGEYLVTYSIGERNITLNPDTTDTKYLILMDLNDDRSHTVITNTVENGPTARLHLRPYSKMEYWSNGALIQTDGCYLN